MNKIMMTGRMVKDACINKTGNGTSVTNFSIAVEKEGKVAEGEPRADFFDCVAWKGTAENLAKYLHKGSKLLIEGELHNKSYVGKDGNKVYKTEITATRVEFLDSKPAAPAQQYQQAPAQQYQQPTAPAPAQGYAPQPQGQYQAQAPVQPQPQQYQQPPYQQGYQQPQQYGNYPQSYMNFGDGETL